MTDVELGAGLADEVRRHGERAYPEEACGFLVGEAASASGTARRRIVRVESMENRVGDQRTRRFVIPPDEVRRFERSLEGSHELLVGFYHSHPDHPAVPSQFDQEHAWPWYTYLVLSVAHGRADELGAFELDPDERRFRPVECTVDAPPLPRE